jgi:putative redox protein
MNANILETNTTLTDEKVRFSGSARNIPAVTMDYFPPLGEGEGYTGLEMLLLSLSGCSSTAVTVLLRKMNKTVKDLSVHASGTRQETAPYGFTCITLDFTLVSPDATESDLEKAIQIAESSMCPVWALLKGNVKIVVTKKVTACLNQSDCQTGINR